MTVVLVRHFNYLHQCMVIIWNDTPVLCICNVYVNVKLSPKGHTQTVT